MNWSPRQTAISDIEVNLRDVKANCLLAYGEIGDDGKPVEGTVVVATTRMETMLGDVGIAVHRRRRYQHLVGKLPTPRRSGTPGCCR